MSTLLCGFPKLSYYADVHNVQPYSQNIHDKGIFCLLSLLRQEKVRMVEAQRMKVTVVRYEEEGKKKGKPVRKKEEERWKEDRR